MSKKLLIGLLSAVMIACLALTATACQNSGAVTAGLYDEDGNLLATYEESGMRADVDLYVSGRIANLVLNEDIDSSIVPSVVISELYPQTTKIVLPETLTKIGEFAFIGAENLVSIEIPASVTEIGGGAFAGCFSLLDITLARGNKNFVIENGALYNKDKTTLIWYNGSNEATSFVVPESVTEIYPFAMAFATNLENIALPANLSALGWGAFCGCENLRSINIPKNVQSIEMGAFAYCRSLISIEIPTSVTSIGSEAFYYCSGLRSIYYAGATESDWDNISISSSNDELAEATRYYYSEEEPTASGNYWHYVDGEIVIREDVSEHPESVAGLYDKEGNLLVTYEESGIFAAFF